MIYFEFLGDNRPFDDADIRDINRLLPHLSNKLKTVDELQLRQILRTGRLLIARNRHNGNGTGEIIGMACLVTIAIPAGMSGYIHDIVVLPSYQGSGIGKKLSVELIDEARRLGYDHIDLTSKPDRVEANALYMKLGFRLRSTAVETNGTNLYRLNLMSP